MGGFVPVSSKNKENDQTSSKVVLRTKEAMAIPPLGGKAALKAPLPSLIMASDSPGPTILLSAPSARALAVQLLKLMLGEGQGNRDKETA